jgi:hypothetical protein
MSADSLEQQCRENGVLYDELDRDVTIDRLVARKAFALYGASGPPESALQPLTEPAVAGGGGPATGEGAKKRGDSGAAAAMLGLGYGSGSDGGESPERELQEGQTLFGALGAQDSGAQANVQCAAKDAAAAKQWEEIEEEEETREDKPMSQYLLEKQAREAAVAAAAETEARAIAAAAAERMRLLEEEEQRLQEAQAAREAVEAHEAEQTHAAEISMARSWDGGEGGREAVELEAGEVGHALAGLAGPKPGSEEYRRQMREVELRVRFPLSSTACPVVVATAHAIVAVAGACFHVVRKLRPQVLAGSCRWLSCKRS